MSDPYYSRSAPQRQYSNDPHTASNPQNRYPQPHQQQRQQPHSSRPDFVSYHQEANGFAPPNDGHRYPPHGRTGQFPDSEQYGRSQALGVPPVSGRRTSADRGYPSSPYHDPYATLTPTQDRPRPDMSTDHLVPEQGGYTKESRYSMSDEGHFQGRGAIAGGPLPHDEMRYSHHHDGRRHRVEPTDGLLPDKVPVLENLNAEQREIMKQFPPDLDDENGGKSGLQAVKEMIKNWKQWFRLRYLHWWVMLVVVIAIVALTTIYHQQIVDWLTPISKKVTTVAWGWIIPVAILFIISFPPLFGHEIVLILVGLVYGIWIGFGIASLGTLLGEIGNFYAFKHCLRSTAAKYERKNVHYACMAEMVREGGFWVMFLARLSAIPGHFTTAVFATVGMNVFIFTFAAILALPKQLLIVYLGVAIKNSGNGQEDTKSKIIKYVVLAISFIITVWTAYWLYQRMEKVRPAVSAKLRKRRYELLLQARTPGTEGYGASGPRHLHTSSYPPTHAYQSGGGMNRVMSGGAPGGGYGYDGRSGSSPDKDAYGSGYAMQNLGYNYAKDRPFGVDEMYNGHPADVSSESYEPPPPMHLPAGRQPIPLQFHRPLRADSNNTGPVSPSSPFSDPQDSFADTSTDGFPQLGYGRPPRSTGHGYGESNPLTNAVDESSPISPSDTYSQPPDYTSVASVSGSAHGHAPHQPLPQGGAHQHAAQYNQAQQAYRHPDYDLQQQQQQQRRQTRQQQHQSGPEIHKYQLRD
ncbi:hypothetical protein BCV70DRAFT_154895 [Testicularia cyperi]|uniref:Golgi apparatus membrane protein TVP38 n=1 Tax=Testicularia cyperi TaxID=1882483 RepID=A0A317XWP9_9BASI|nr:hypothetical protein BCV70DRAFT_154895 [Testicularia cyperi]